MFILGDILFKVELPFKTTLSTIWWQKLQHLLKTINGSNLNQRFFHMICFFRVKKAGILFLVQHTITVHVRQFPATIVVRYVLCFFLWIKILVFVSIHVTNQHSSYIIDVIMPQQRLHITDMWGIWRSCQYIKQAQLCVWGKWSNVKRILVQHFIMCAILISRALGLTHANDRSHTHANEGSHSFNCHPHVYPQVLWAILLLLPSRRASAHFGQYLFPAVVDHLSVSTYIILYINTALFHLFKDRTGLSLGPPGWAGARRELLDFMVQGKINRGRHIDHPAGRHSIQTNQRSLSPPFFTVRMPFLPPNQQCQSTDDTDDELPREISTSQNAVMLCIFVQNSAALGYSACTAVFRETT